MQEIFKTELQATYVFNVATLEGLNRWNDFHIRLVEHNIRVVSCYYSRISFARLLKMLDLSSETAEEILTNLVNAKTIWAKIDRLSGVVLFKAPEQPFETLNNWSQNLNQLLGCIISTNHLINKEEMIDGLTVQLQNK